MIYQLYNYIFGCEIEPDERQVRLRHVLMQQIRLSKLKLNKVNDSDDMY